MTPSEEAWKEVRMAARAAGAHRDSLDDFLGLPSVRSRIVIDEDGRTQFLDEGGVPLLGISDEEFFRRLSVAKPRYFEAAPRAEPLGSRA